MALFTFTGSVDLSTKPKRLGGWHLSQGAGVQTVNLRNGSLTGPIMVQVQLPATTSASQSYDVLPIFTGGVYVEVVGTGFTVGSVNLV
jgi:hypothetical protein